MFAGTLGKTLTLADVLEIKLLGFEFVFPLLFVHLVWDYEILTSVKVFLLFLDACLEVAV